MPSRHALALAVALAAATYLMHRLTAELAQAAALDAELAGVDPSSSSARRVAPLNGHAAHDLEPADGEAATADG